MQEITWLVDLDRTSVSTLVYKPKVGCIREITLPCTLLLTWRVRLARNEMLVPLTDLFGMADRRQVVPAMNIWTQWWKTVAWVFTPHHVNLSGNGFRPKV